MGWISRYGKWQDDFARPVPGLIKFHHVIAVIFFLALLAGYIACFPLTLAFVPKPQLTEYMPKGVHCATCDEIWQYNPDLFNREDMLCYGPSTRVRHQPSKASLYDADRSRKFRPRRRRKSCMKGKRGVGPSRKGTTSGCVPSRCLVMIQDSGMHRRRLRSFEVDVGCEMQARKTRNDLGNHMILNTVYSTW